MLSRLAWRGLAVALLVTACGHATPPPASPRPAAAPAPTAASVARDYTITTSGQDGESHVTKLAITVPDSWHARLDTPDGAPAFESAPNQTVVVLDVQHMLAPPDEAIAAAEKGVSSFLGVAATRRTELPGGRVRAVFDPSTGPQVTVLFASAGASYVASCMIQLDRQEVARAQALDKICDTMQIVATEDHPAATPPADAPHPVVITPKRRVDGGAPPQP